MSYTKLHYSLVTSTIWREANHIRVAWITMLAIGDKNGEVMASIPGLADICRISIPEMEEALASFMAPDPYSRTKDFDGRRIEEIDGGWALLNHPKYRRMASIDYKIEAAAERQARKRSRDSKRDTALQSRDVTQRHGSVTPESDTADDRRQTTDDRRQMTEADDERSPSLAQVVEEFDRSGAPREMAEAFFLKWEAKGWQDENGFIRWPKLVAGFVTRYRKNHGQADAPAKSGKMTAAQAERQAAANSYAVAHGKRPTAEQLDEFLKSPEWTQQH